VLALGHIDSKRGNGGLRYHKALAIGTTCKTFTLRSENRMMIISMHHNNAFL